MNGQQIEVRRLGRPGDLGWVVMAHGEVYAAEFGWDASFEALVARIVADYAAGSDPEREAAWIAEIGGRRVGCVFCVAAGETTAQLRILLVHPSARGRHLGGTLVDECVAFARQAGYAGMKLWTNHPLAAARRVYLSRGFTLVEEEPHHSFGVDLTGQVYQLDLRPRLAGTASRTLGYETNRVHNRSGPGSARR
jgi:GNAT superfamily N-acetyltransferase